MKPTLLDVLCGLEPGDRIEYSNRYGQTFQGTVERVITPDAIIMLRAEWQAAGFGTELLKADQYQLEKVLSR